LHQKTVLRNGIRVLTEKIPFAHSVSTGIWVGVGSRDEEEDERGITHFIEHMLFKGTQRRSALDIAKEFDSVGGFANAFTSKEHVCVHAKVLASHLPLVVDVLSDIFLNSVFSDNEIEREQQVIVQEIRMIEDTPDEYVHILFQEMFWKDNPLGLPIYGSAKALESLDRTKVLRYLSRHFHSDKIVISAAGNLDHDRFLELIGPPMEGLNHPASPGRRVVPKNHPLVRIIPKDLELVHICLGMRGNSQVDENRFASHILNVVLGSSMSSRLFQEIREKRGLAYSVYSFSHSHVDAGILGIYAGVGARNVRETLELIREQLSLLADELISDGELNAAKEYLRGSMYLNAESTDSRMNRMAKNEFLFGRFVDFSEIEEKIAGVRAGQIREWFREVYIPQELTVLLMGPVEMDRADVEKALS